MLIKWDNIFTLLLCFAIGTSGKTLKAAEPNQDSVTKVFPMVEVNAESMVSSRAMKFGSVYIIDKAKIEKNAAWQISDILKQSPGVYIKDYGGLGGLKTISLRGTSSQQTAILLDGIPMNSAQNASIDLSTLPVSIFNNIEVFKGGASSMFGSNALGGAVNLRTDKILREQKMNLDFKYGSFGVLFSALSYDLPLNNAGISSNLEFQKSDGDYSFKVNHFGENMTLTRHNADFQNFNIFVNSFINDSLTKYSFKIIARDSKRGAPGAVVQGLEEGVRARLNEQEIFLIGSYNHIFNDFSSFGSNISFKSNYTNYSNPDEMYKEGQTMNTGFTNNSYKLNSKYLSIFENINIESGFDLDYSSLYGDMLQQNTNKFVDRFNSALFFRADKSYLLNNGSEFAWNLGIRYDYVMNRNSAISPSAGLIYKIYNYFLTFKLLYTHNFRCPSFNEMYYLNYGTKDLKDETSNSYNLSANFSPLSWFNIESNIFYIATKNQIISIPLSTIKWSAANLGATQSYGFDLLVYGNLFGTLIDYNFAYTELEAKDVSSHSLTKNKTIPYTPNVISNARISLNLEKFSLNTIVNYSSYRYLFSDNNSEDILPSYWTMDLSCSYAVNIIPKVKMKLKFEINNIFDKSYEIISKYYMPGRSLRAGISAEF